MSTISKIAMLSLMIVTSPALAGESSAQRAACTPDVWRLCSPDIPDVGAIKACLRREKAKLTPGCRTVMDNADKPAAPVQTAATRSITIAQQ